MKDNAYYLVEGGPKDLWVYYHFIVNERIVLTRKFSQAGWQKYFRLRILEGIK